MVDLADKRAERVSVCWHIFSPHLFLEKQDFSDWKQNHIICFCIKLANYSLVKVDICSSVQ